MQQIIKIEKKDIRSSRMKSGEFSLRVGAFGGKDNHLWIVFSSEAVDAFLVDVAALRSLESKGAKNGKA